MFSINSLYLAGILQGLFLISLLMFNRKCNRRANLFLAGLVGLLIATIWNTYVWKVGLGTQWLLLSYNLWSGGFLWGPIIYFYVGIISGAFVPENNRVFRHLTIFFFLFILQLPFHLLTEYGLISTGYRAAIQRIVMLGFYIHISLYLYASFQVLSAYKHRLKDHYSYLDKVNLSWLQRLILLFAFLAAADMATSVPAFILHQEFIYWDEILLAEAITIYLIGFFSLSQAEILFHPRTADTYKKQGTDINKYGNSSLDYRISEDMTSKLNEIMEDSKIYQKNDLRLPDLAEMIGLSTHHLSQLINEHCQNNFYDYINKYRVEFAANALIKNEKSNITDIAFESGFNNRTSFNNSFKKHLGMTPTKYRRLNQGKKLLHTI